MYKKSVFSKSAYPKSLSPLGHSVGFASCKARCVLISASLPNPPFPRERLCMLGWLCICAIVVVCCRCVLHRLCSTTCMRPCIEHLGIHARRPCRAECGATAPRPCRGLRPCDPIFNIYKRFIDSLRQALLSLPFYFYEILNQTLYFRKFYLSSPIFLSIISG